jgi:Lon protease-like protein
VELMARRDLPMFPLGTVLFPHAVLPLHVFEPRYRVMVRRCLDGDGEFGVVLIERGSEVGGGDVRFDIGTVSRIIQASELPDGRFALSTVGIRRLQVLRWLDEDPFPRAEVDELDEPEQTADDAPARDDVLRTFGDVLALWHRLDDRVPTEAPAASGDIERDVYQIAATAPLGPLDAQRVLEATGTRARSAVLQRCLGDLAAELHARLAE